MTVTVTVTVFDLLRGEYGSRMIQWSYSPHGTILCKPSNWGRESEFQPRTHHSVRSMCSMGSMRFQNSTRFMRFMRFVRFMCRDSFSVPEGLAKNIS